MNNRPFSERYSETSTLPAPVTTPNEKHPKVQNHAARHAGEKPPWQRFIDKMGVDIPGSKAAQVKNEIVAAIGEFVGTTLFLFFAFGGTNVANIRAPEDATAINSTVDPSQLLFIALSFGFSLMVCVWVFFRVSGGLFNPAVSFALALVGVITWKRMVTLVFSQILGGIAASALLLGLLPGELQVRTTLNPSISIAQGLFLEMFLTAMLVITILMLAAEKHKATFLAPIGIGLALFIAELTGVYYTGGSLNPARSFGPDVVLGKFNGYHWIYWLGPVLGATIAAGFYRFLKLTEYEKVNPDQDSDGDEEGGGDSDGHLPGEASTHLGTAPTLLAVAVPKHGAPVVMTPTMVNELVHRQETGEGSTPLRPSGMASIASASGSHENLAEHSTPRGSAKKTDGGILKDQHSFSDQYEWQQSNAHRQEKMDDGGAGTPTTLTAAPGYGQGQQPQLSSHLQKEGGMLPMSTSLGPRV